MIATSGYCIMNTDEGTGFLDDMTKKEVKHESDISLMNQLFDGKGDKMSLAKGNERHVPANSTCISISVQPQPFCKALAKMQRTLWLENGFGDDSYLPRQNHTSNYIKGTFLNLLIYKS